MVTIKKPKYPKICAVLRSKDEKAGPLSVEVSKEFIGWTEEPDGDDWGAEFVLKDMYGRKIRLANNPTNRPFKRPLADRYANEHLRAKWSLNLETVVISNLGFVLQGQHRLVGLILGEQIRQIDPKTWGNTPLVYETLMGFGVSSKPEVANTFDTGSGRGLGDVIYRHQKFGKKVTDKEQKKIGRILAGAIRLVWLRAGGKQVSFAPHFPHSEAIEFYGKHPGIFDSVQTINALDSGEGGGEKNISLLLSLSYASALHYLMVRYRNVNSAKDFWSEFASGADLKKGSPILALRQLLQKSDASSGSKRDEVIGAVIKAWNLCVKGEKVKTIKDIRVAKKKDGERFILAEFPRLGGLDEDVEVEVSLTKQQLIVMSVLRATKKELTYKELSEATGLQSGVLAKALVSEVASGKQYPNSLQSRGLVSVSEHEPQEGEKVSSLRFKLTVPDGRK